MDDYPDAAHTAVELLADHVAEARTGLGPVNVQPDPDTLAEELDLARWIEAGGMDAAALGLGGGSLVTSGPPRRLRVANRAT
jgi:hypothetical protein